MTEEVTAPEAEVAEAAEAPQLTLQDMATMVQIVDMCSERGAFKGVELEAVGVVRNRLVRFLNAATPPQEVPEGAVPADGEDQPAVEETEAAA